MKDRFKQEFKIGDTIIFMRSRGNSLNLGLILEINKNGNARILEDNGYKGILLLTRTHRIIKTTDPIHVKAMLEKVDKHTWDNTKTTGKDTSNDSVKNLLQI